MIPCDVHLGFVQVSGHVWEYTVCLLFQAVGLIYNTIEIIIISEYVSNGQMSSLPPSIYVHSCYCM